MSNGSGENLSQLTALTNPLPSDLLYALHNVSSSPVDNSLALSVLAQYLGTTAMPFNSVVTKSPWIDITHPSYGAVGNGTNNDATAIQNAINAAQLINGIVFFPPNENEWAIGNQLQITSPVTLIGAGAGSYENQGFFTPGTRLKWIGNGGGTMLQIGNGTNTVSGIRLENLAFDGNSSAGSCLAVYEMAESEFRNVLQYNYQSIGMQLNSYNGAGRNLMFNDFHNLNFYSTATNNQAIVSYDTTVSNIAFNRFYHTRVVFAGNNSGIVLKGDNNTFFGLFLYSASGTGYGLEINGGNGSWGNNYLFGVSPSSTGIHITNNSGNNLIFGYDMANGQPYPVVDSGSGLMAFTNGVSPNNLVSIIGVRGISSSYTASKNLGGGAVVPQGNTSVNISLPTAETNSNYFAVVTPMWSTTCYLSNLATTGFTINFGTGAPSGGSFVGYYLIRYQ